MNANIENAVRQKLMLSFTGSEAPDTLLSLVRGSLGGVTLFRHFNVRHPAQVRDLTSRLQHAARAAGQPPLLIGADQEGGQLNALGEGTTDFPGNLALGAVADPDLAYRVGQALGREQAALGVNVAYAPVCDVNCNPLNPVVGTRSFGEDPQLVAHLAGAMTRGIQSAGIAATAKHFPGHGDTDSDSHYGTPQVAHDAQRLRQVELPPFAAAIQAGVHLIMTAHVALPAFTGRSDLPSTLSPEILQGLLRQELGFGGVIISDAMDMGAITQGMGLIVDTLAATAAGVDLLLLKHDPESFAALEQGLLQGVRRGLLTEEWVLASAGRILQLKQWLAGCAQPGLEVVGCPEHQALAQEVARRSITLVRNDAGLLPLRLTPEAKLAALMPQPVDLTPADTSSFVRPGLAAALRSQHAEVQEWVIPLDPTDSDVAALRQQLQGYDLCVVGTINAREHRGQAALVQGLLADGIPTVAVALRMPYDLQAYPEAPTYICTYNLLPPSLEALARALWGHIPFRGRLPVSIPGLYERQAKVDG